VGLLAFHTILQGSEKNPMRAARTGRWVRAPSWRLAIGSDARESRAARALLSLACCSARLCTSTPCRRRPAASPLEQLWRRGLRPCHNLLGMIQHDRTTTTVQGKRRLGHKPPLLVPLPPECGRWSRRRKSAPAVGRALRVPVGTKPVMGGDASNGQLLCVLESQDGPPAAATVEVSRVDGPLPPARGL
jgi:hypothetical protein